MTGRRTNRALRTAVIARIAVVAVAGGCAPDSAVRWDEVRPLAGSLEDGSILVLAGDSGVALHHEDARGVLPRGPMCDGSLRTAADGQGGRFAAWWEPRDDSNVVLVVAAWENTEWG